MRGFCLGIDDDVPDFEGFPAFSYLSFSGLLSKILGDGILLGNECRLPGSSASLGWRRRRGRRGIPSGRRSRHPPKPLFLKQSMQRLFGLVSFEFHFLHWFAVVQYCQYRRAARNKLDRNLFVGESRPLFQKLFENREAV